MDDVDRITEREEVEGPARLASHRRPPGPAPIGECLNCEAPLEPPGRWCNSECHVDWHRQQRADEQRPR